jgi:hypothetical protein
MKRYSAWGQVFEDGLNVVLRPTCDTNVDIREVEADKFIHKVEDLFSRRWNRRRDRTFVERIHDDISRSLCLEGEHFFETFYHSSIGRFPHPAVVFRIESGEYIATRIGPSRKLDKERGKQVGKILFIDVPEVEIEIRHRGPPVVA